MNGPAEHFFEKTNEHAAVVADLRAKSSQEQLINYLDLDIMKQLFLFNRYKKIEYLQQAKMSLLELMKESRKLDEKSETIRGNIY